MMERGAGRALKKDAQLRIYNSTDEAIDETLNELVDWLATQGITGTTAQPSQAAPVEDTPSAKRTKNRGVALPGTQTE